MEVINGVLTGVTNMDVKNGTFVFPEGVTSIGKFAFEYCDSLTSIEIQKCKKSVKNR